MPPFLLNPANRQETTREPSQLEDWKLGLLAIDMDKIETWPNEVTAFLTANSKKLRREREAEREYSHSPSRRRMLTDAPSMPRWNEAMALVENVLADRELVAFHATRLVDFKSVQKEGLLRLNLAQHVARVKGHLMDAGAIEELAEVDAAVTRMHDADRFFPDREGAVWATPHRALLHDGGCEVFYDSLGGEALERIAGYAHGKLEQRLKQIGKPAVVIFRYPAYGWCTFTPDRLPQSMIELHLQQEGDWEASDYGWDIMINRDVPAENIVAVVPPNDLAVAV